MESVKVAGRRYTDPDVISLIRATGQLVDPRSAVLTQARRLNEQYVSLGGDGHERFERLKILASLRGLSVEPMDARQSARERRDAVLMPTADGRGKVLYNPSRHSGRINFSIAHEITHTFFPNSVSGARFRTMCDPGSREANELERLCDLGASEMLMPIDEFGEALGGRFSLEIAEAAMSAFGSSYESTVFRMATAHPRLAAAGLLRYRYSKEEERALASSRQQRALFEKSARVKNEAPVRKYRRQSFFMSDACADKHIIRWNKSFILGSSVYAAGVNGGIHRAEESLPNAAAIVGTLEAIRAPYQRDEADPDCGDVLFFWQAK
jgi:Zn-dependent peptidase ImmA (M78 family)